MLVLGRFLLGAVAVSSLLLAGCSSAGASCASSSDCGSTAACVIEAGAGAGICATLCSPDGGQSCGSGSVCIAKQVTGCDGGIGCGTETVCR